MVLIKPLLIGLILLLTDSAKCATTQEPQRNRSQIQETTTISVNNNTIATRTSQVLTSTTQKVIITTKTTTTSTTPSTPKTEPSNKITEQSKRNRGSVKYFDTKPKATNVVAKETVHEPKIIKQTTARNDRSLNVNTDKYNPEFQSENNIYAETQDGDTKKYASFDNKDRFTTEKVWERPNFDSIELTTPKDESFDSKHKQIQEDVAKSFQDKDDDFFEENKDREEADNIEKPQLNDSKLDYVRFRNLEAIETKVKNKIHKDYTSESGVKMEMSTAYNDTKIIDAPGIVVNTIPTSQKDSVTKKPDLDQDETKLERISIEKPNTIINNKIESEFGRLDATEGSEDKPLEHKGIYLSKRGSTTQNKEQIIEKTLSTESIIPLELYPAKVPSSPNLEETTNASVSKNLKKLKVLKKDMDLDNKIPKFLPSSTEKIQKSEVITSNITSQTISSTEIAETTTQENLDETDSSSDESQVKTATEEFTTTHWDEDATEFVTPDFDFYEATADRDFYEATDTPLTEETTIFTEMTTDTSGMEFSTTGSNDNTDSLTETVNFAEHSTQYDTGRNFDNTFRSPVKYDDDNESKMTKILDFANENVTDREENGTSTISAKIFYNTTSSSLENLDATTEKIGTTTSPDNMKKNETIPKVINEITKPSYPTTTTSTTDRILTTGSTKIQRGSTTEAAMHIDEVVAKANATKQPIDNDPPRQNEINTNGDRIVPDDCDNIEEGEEYSDNNCKPHIGDDINEPEVDLEEHNGNGQSKSSTTSSDTSLSKQTTLLPTFTVTIIEKDSASTIKATAQFNAGKSRKLEPISEDSETTTRSDSIISAEDDEDSGNGGKIAAIVISTVGGICLLLLVALLVIMKKRQKRFNYGQRCRPVSLDAYSMDNVSIHNSTRRKGVLMTSKRSYGNPAFEDPACPSHLLNYSELLKFSNNQEGIKSEFDKIPLVTTKTNELPEGCDVKNRYANVIPLPETRVFLNQLDGVPGSDYINANYVTGPQGARHYYIACQAPMQNTIEDFWRMIWEQQSKVVLMLTHLYENGVEKCIDYLPPSEVLDCHRLFGDYQITLKKREVKDKYIISSLQLKNMVSSSWREVTHLWYMGWPEKGVPDETSSIVAFLIEARSYIKLGDTKIKETINTNISNGLTPNLNPVIVHCSPGTGRTGTVIACDIAVREFELTRKVDIPKIVYKIRRDRASAVQTKEQYLYIYKVINFYATKLTGGIFDSF